MLLGWKQSMKIPSEKEKIGHQRK